MRNSLILPLAIAIGCGTIAAVGVTHAMRSNTGTNEPVTTEILVAVQDLDVGDEIVADNVRLEKWPADRVPVDATNDLKQIEGQFLNQRLFAGEPILIKKLNQTNDSTTARIPQGFRAVTLDLKGDPGLAYLVQPGHRADVMGFFEKDNVIPETSIRTVLSDVRIFAVDGETVRREEQEGARKPAKTVSLLIREEDQEAWTWAEQLGKLKLSLRNERGSSSDATGPNKAGKEFLGWIQVSGDKKPPEPKISTTPVAPSVSKSVAAEPEPKEDWRMEIWTPEGPQVYQWRDGERVPELIDTSAKSTKNSKNTNSSVDYSYLSGSQSPFFQDNTGAAPGEPVSVPSGVTAPPRDENVDDLKL